MTTIIYNCAYNRVSMRGHAGAGTAGNDLVCAALSALLRVLLLECDKHGGNASQGDGYAIVNLHACSRPLLAGVCNAFKWMSEEYPDYVAFKCVDGG